MKRAHRIAMTTDVERDALTSCRHVYHWRPGQRKVAKRLYNHRQRATLNGILRKCGC